MAASSARSFRCSAAASASSMAVLATLAVLGLGLAVSAEAALLALATWDVALAMGWENDVGMVTGVGMVMGVDFVDAEVGGPLELEAGAGEILDSVVPDEEIVIPEGAVVDA